MREEPALATTAPASAAADDRFGADLYLLVTEDSSDTVFSPVSVASTLRMALCGARGQTATELASALHLNGSPDAADGGLTAPSPDTADGGLTAPSPDTAGGGLTAPSPDTAAEGLRALSALLRDVTARGSVTFRAPNTAWVQSGLPLMPGFTARLRDAAATVADADFAAAPEAARTEINRVIAEQTDGKITGLLAPRTIDAATRLVLTSAVYLKAAWVQPFPGSATGDAPFYPDGPDRPSLTVPMMRGTAVRAYLRGDGYQAVVLPYQGGSLAMAVVLPDGPLTALRSTIATGGLRGLLAGTARHQVTLWMPRFRLEAAFDLIPALQRLGVTEAFTGHADFSGITDAARLLINAVAHKAYIDVDEQGTEAAAATAITFRTAAAFRSPPPVTVIVDRPFLFAIIDTQTGLPLFLGQVSHPRSR